MNSAGPAGLLAYVAALRPGKTVLWCYLIWYLVTVYQRFDATPAIWLNSVGISVVIGIALLLSVGGPRGRSTDRWQNYRLFIMPFCVSSFSSLIKGHGYILIVPPTAGEQLACIGAIAAFVLFVGVVKRLHRHA